MAPSVWQLLIVLLIVVMIFGTKKLKNIGSDLGGAIRNFKEGMRDASADTTAAAEVGTNAQHLAHQPPGGHGETIDVQAREASRES